MCRIVLLVSWVVFLSAPGFTQERTSPENSPRELQPGPSSRPNDSPSQASLTCTAPESTSHLPICKLALLLLLSPSDSTDKNGTQEIFQLSPEAPENRISPLPDRFLDGATLAVDYKLPKITLQFPEVTCQNAGSYACEVLQLQSGEDVGRGGGGGGRGGGSSRFGGEEECRRILAKSDEVEDGKNESSFLWQRSVFRVEKTPDYVSMRVRALAHSPFPLVMNCSVATSLEVEWIWEVHSLTRGWIRTANPVTTTSEKQDLGHGACLLHSSVMSEDFLPSDEDDSVDDVSNVRCYVIARNKSYVDGAGYLNASLGGQRLIRSEVSSSNSVANGGLMLIGGILMAAIVLLILLVRLERQGTLGRLRTRLQRSGGHWRRSRALGLSGDGDKQPRVKDAGLADVPPATSPRHRAAAAAAERDGPPPPNTGRHRLSPRLSPSLRVKDAQGRGSRTCPTLEVADERQGGSAFCKVVTAGKARARPMEERSQAQGIVVILPGGKGSLSSEDRRPRATSTPKTATLQSLDKVIREISAEAQIATERILKTHQNTLKDCEAERKDPAHGEGPAPAKKLQLPVHSRTSLMRLKLSETIKAAVKEQQQQQQQQQDTGPKKVQFPRLSAKSPPKLSSPERWTTRAKNEKCVALSLTSPPKIPRSSAAAAAGEVGSVHADDARSHKLAASHVVVSLHGREARNKSWHAGMMVRRRSPRRSGEKQGKSSSGNGEEASAASADQPPVRVEDAGTKEKWSGALFSQSPLVHRAMRVCSSPPKLNLAFKLRQEKQQRSADSGPATKDYHHYPRKLRHNGADRAKSQDLENYVSLNKVTLRRVGRFRPNRTAATQTSERGHLDTFTHPSQPSPQFAYERQAPGNDAQPKIGHSFSENKMATIVIRNRSCDNVSQRTKSSNSLVKPPQGRAAFPLGRRRGGDPDISALRPFSAAAAAAVLGNLGDPISKSVGDLCGVSKQMTTRVREHAARGGGDPRLLPLQQSCGHVPGLLASSMQAGPDADCLPLADTASSECSINLSLYSTTSSLMSEVSCASKDGTRPNSLCADFDQVSDGSALEISSSTSFSPSFSSPPDKGERKWPTRKSSLPVAFPQGCERSQSLIPATPENSTTSVLNRGYALPFAAPVPRSAAQKREPGMCSYSTSSLPQLKTRPGVHQHSSQVSASTSDRSRKLAFDPPEAAAFIQPGITCPSPSKEPDLDKALVRPASKEAAEVSKPRTDFPGKEFASAGKTGDVTVREDSCFLSLESSPTGDCYLCEHDFASAAFPEALTTGQSCVADVRISGGSDGEGDLNLKILSEKTTSKKLPSLTGDRFAGEATGLQIQTHVKEAHVSQVGGGGTPSPSALSPTNREEKNGGDALNADTQGTLEQDSTHVKETRAGCWSGHGREKVTVTPAVPGSSEEGLVQHNGHLVVSLHTSASQSKVGTVGDLKTTSLECKEAARVQDSSREEKTPQRCQRMEKCSDLSKLKNTPENSIESNANGLEPTPLEKSLTSKEAEYVTESPAQESGQELAGERLTRGKEFSLQPFTTEHDLAFGLKNPDEGKRSYSMDTIYDMQRKVSEKGLQSASATSNPLTACEEHALKTKGKDGRLMSRQPYSIRRTTEKHRGKKRDTREATRKDRGAEDVRKPTQPNPLLSRNDVDSGKSRTSANTESETTKHPQLNGENLMSSEQVNQNERGLKDTGKDQDGNLGVLHGDPEDGHRGRSDQRHQTLTVGGTASPAPNRPPDILQFFKGENERMAPEGSSEVSRVSLKLV